MINPLMISLKKTPTGTVDQSHENVWMGTNGGDPSGRDRGQCPKVYSIYVHVLINVLH